MSCLITFFQYFFGLSIILHIVLQPAFYISLVGRHPNSSAHIQIILVLFLYLIHYRSHFHFFPNNPVLNLLTLNVFTRLKLVFYVLKLYINYTNKLKQKQYILEELFHKYPLKTFSCGQTTKGKQRYQQPGPPVSFTSNWH